VNHCWAFPACTRCIDKTFDRAQTKRRPTMFSGGSDFSRNNETEEGGRGLSRREFANNVSWESMQNGIETRHDVAALR